MAYLPNSKSNRTGWPWTLETDPDRYSIHSLWPKITVITPSFNQGEYIEETIRSIILQNYPNLEYIIMDGGSSDQTVEIIRAYAPWISYWVSETDQGQSHAINKGMKMAKGEVTNWINSDDLLAQDALFHIGLAFIENKAIDFVCGKTRVLDSTSSPEILNPTAVTDQRSNLYGFPHPQMSSFYRLELVKKLGYIDSEFRFSMDYDLFVRIYLCGKMLAITPLVAYFRTHPASKTNTLESVRLEDDKIVFTRLLNTFKYPDLIRHFKYLGYFQTGQPVYASEKLISEEDMRYCLYLFLKTRIYDLQRHENPRVFFKVLSLLKHSGDKFIFDQHVASLYRKSYLKLFLSSPYELFKLSNYRF